MKNINNAHLMQGLTFSRDSMTGTGKEVLKQKQDLQKEADGLREQRDKANAVVKQLAVKRGAFLDKLDEKYKEADALREKRNTLNTDVKKLKDEIVEFEKQVEDKVQAFNEVKKRKLPKEGLSVGDLKRQLKEMEFKQMTQVLTAPKEKALLKEMGVLRTQLKGKEKLIADDDELRAANDEVKAVKEKHRAMYENLHKVADEAQEFHDKMTGILREADKEEKGLGKLMKELDGAKGEADKIHNKYIETVNKIYEMERGERGEGEAEQKERAIARETEAKAEADKIFDKFKRGEKLTTDDFMTLQKAGLL
jgi:uncharacterized coiled-coil DUF342 family protein